MCPYASRLDIRMHLGDMPVCIPARCPYVSRRHLGTPGPSAPRSPARSPPVSRAKRPASMMSDPRRFLIADDYGLGDFLSLMTCLRSSSFSSIQRPSSRSSALFCSRSEASCLYEIWPRCGRDVAEMWPRCGRDMAEIWPRYGRDMAEMLPVFRTQLLLERRRRFRALVKSSIAMRRVRL